MFFLASIPAVVQAVVAAASVASSVVSGVMSYQSNKANAAAAKEEGKQAMAAAQEEASRQRRQVASIQGSLRAQAGAQGTTFEGSPMEVYLENAKQGELMAQDSLYQGKLKKAQAKAQAAYYNQQATGSIWKTVFGTVGSVASAFGDSGSSGDSGGTSSISPGAYSLEGGGGLLSTYSVNGLAKPRYSING